MKTSVYIDCFVETGIKLGTIGFLEIEDGRPQASIFRLTETGIEPFDWSTWRRT